MESSKDRHVPANSKPLKGHLKDLSSRNFVDMRIRLASKTTNHSSKANGSNNRNFALTNWKQGAGQRSASHKPKFASQSRDPSPYLPSTPSKPVPSKDIIHVPSSNKFQAKVSGGPARFISKEVIESIKANRAIFGLAENSRIQNAKNESGTSKGSDSQAKLFARRKSSGATQETPHKRIFGAMVSRLELLQRLGGKLPVTSRANESRILLDTGKTGNEHHGKGRNKLIILSKDESETSSEVRSILNLKEESKVKRPLKISLSKPTIDVLPHSQKKATPKIPLLGVQAKSNAQSRANSPGDRRTILAMSHREKEMKAGAGYGILSRRKSSSGEVTASLLKDQAAGDKEEREKLVRFNKNYFKAFHEIPPTSLENYRIIKLIGKGAFATVSLGVHKMSGKYVAIKTINKARMKNSGAKMKVLQEVLLQKRMHHPNVIRLYEIFETLSHLYIVMEYAAKGDLLEYVKKKGRLSPPESRKIFRQIVYGLAHIHSRGVIHRDIKLDNIFLDDDLNPKIGDFGVSKAIAKNEFMDEQCGTPAYLAPEIIQNTGYNGFYADHWSLGIVLYAIVCAAVPYKADNLDELHKVITSTIIAFPCKLVAELKSLIRRLLSIEPLRRPSLPEILGNEWLCGERLHENSEDLDCAACVAKGCDNSEIKASISISNIFYDENENKRKKEKISVGDYYKICGDFVRKGIEEQTVKEVEALGYDRETLLRSLNADEINHATATYYILLSSSRLDNRKTMISL